MKLIIAAAHTGQRSVDLEELEKEYTLTSAQLLLVENNVQMGIWTLLVICQFFYVDTILDYLFLFSCL